jgi:ferritin-like metal-binding protein YciE
MKLGSLQEVFAHELNDLRSAEEQLVEALPKMAGAASSGELRKAFENHLLETRGHLERIEELLTANGIAKTTAVCKGMKGLIEEGAEVVKTRGDDMAKDAALIAAAQRVEHYEIAAYGTAVTLAGQLDLDDAKDTLDQTLDEEENADKLLTKIATGGVFGEGVNQKAAR